MIVKWKYRVSNRITRKQNVNETEIKAQTVTLLIASITDLSSVSMTVEWEKLKRVIFLEDIDFKVLP